MAARPAPAAASAAAGFGGGGSFGGGDSAGGGDSFGGQRGARCGREPRADVPRRGTMLAEPSRRGPADGGSASSAK